jgi:hypothetical protein
MKTLLTGILFVIAAPVYAQSLEADLDGNAGALQASEMRTQPQAPRQRAQAAPRRDPQRVATRS